MAGSKPGQWPKQINNLLSSLKTLSPPLPLGSPSLSLGLSIELSPAPAPMRSSGELKGAQSHTGAGSHCICPEIAPVSCPLLRAVVRSQ